jgi:hypothetical protein
MRTDSPEREAPEKAGSQSPTAPRLLESIVRPAAPLDVMMEQIEYLAGHAVEACPSRSLSLRMGVKTSQRVKLRQTDTCRVLALTEGAGRISATQVL